MIQDRMTATKAVVAGIGATLTALTTALATVTLALSDDKIDTAEIGSLTVAATTLVTTIWAVWKVRNKPKP